MAHGAYWEHGYGSARSGPGYGMTLHAVGTIIDGIGSGCASLWLCRLGVYIFFCFEFVHFTLKFAQKLLLPQSADEPVKKSLALSALLPCPTCSSLFPFTTSSGLLNLAFNGSQDSAL